MDEPLAVCLALFCAGSDAACGRTPVSPTNIEIVGGNIAKEYSWPWQIVLCNKGWLSCSLTCGGSIISNQWIMSAGHCVYGRTNSPGGYKVKMGVFNEKDNNEPGEIVTTIDRIVLHPQYSHSKTDHDISLLHLSKPIAFTDHIQPVCLPPGDDAIALAPGKSVTVTGWGTTSSGGFISSKLRQVTVPVLPQSQCDSDYTGEIDDDDMFCAGVQGKDSCQGDSGGPVVQKNTTTGVWTQYGIVSWGQGCAQKNYPGVYSRVNSFRSWIKSVTGV